MKRILFFISIIGMLLVSCEKEADVGDFLDDTQIERLKIISRGVLDPETGLLIDPVTNGIIDPVTGIIIDPETGLEINPNTGELIDPNNGGSDPDDTNFAKRGDLVGLVGDDDFVLLDAFAFLEGELLTITLIGESGESITMSVNNPETRPFGLEGDSNFSSILEASEAAFTTDASEDLVEPSTLQLVYDEVNVSGEFKFTVYTDGPEPRTSKLVSGSFAKIRVDQ